MEELWDRNWEEKLYLPPGQSYYKICYVNKKNGDSRWGKPFDIDGNPLPKGWERVYSDKQKKYYYLNTNTNKTQLKKPLLRQNNYSPHTYYLDLVKPSLSEIFDGHPHIRTSSGRYVNETPVTEDGIEVYRSRSGDVKYDRLPQRPYEPTETIFIYERCCEEPTQFPSRFCAESLSHAMAAHVSYVFTATDNNLDGFVEIRNKKAIQYSPKYESIGYIRKKDKVKTYTSTFKDVTIPSWLRSTKPVVQEEHNLSDHDAIILNLRIETTQGEGVDMPFNIISMNLEGLCKVKEDDPYRYIDYMNSYFDPHIKTGTIMVFQEVVLKSLATTVYKKDVDTDDGSVNIRDVLAVEEAGNQILQVLQTANPDIPLEFRSDTYTSGILYDTSIWDIHNVKTISRLYQGKLESKFSNAYLFSSKDGNCTFWVVNIHLKSPFGSPEYIADANEQISISLGRSEKKSYHVNNMHIIELNNIVSKLKEASQNFEIPVYLCGDYNNGLPKGFLVKKAIESLDEFYDPNGMVL